MRGAGVEVIPYMVGARPQPGDFAGVIEQMCLGYLVRKSLVDPDRLLCRKSSGTWIRRVMRPES